MYYLVKQLGTKGSGLKAIYLEGGDGHRIVDNTFDHVSGQAVHVKAVHDTLIQGNRILRCSVGVSFTSHFTDDWVNRGARVLGNHIEGPGFIGIKLDQYADRHFIGENVILGMTESVR